MDSQLAELHGVSCFIGALAKGAETNLGRGCLGVCSLAGKKFGLEAVQNAPVTDDPVQALKILAEALTARGIQWEFEPFPGAGGQLVTEEGSRRQMRLVFRTCMVRSALFRYGHEQKQSLCHMSHGVFSGAMERIMPGRKVELEILHAGPNACLKIMSWEPAS